MPISQNVYDNNVLGWSPDAVEPQLGIQAISSSVRLAPSTSYPKGALLAELTGTPGTFGLYANGGSGGLGTWKAILPRAATTDASGNIYEAPQASDELIGVTYLVEPAFFSGVFKQSDLSGFDANAFTNGPTGIKVIRGAVATGNALIKL